MEFVAEVVDGFNVGVNDVRVGLIEFSALSTVSFDFQTYYNKSELVDAILNTTKTDGGTNTHTALDLAKNQLFTPGSGSRYEAARCSFLLV